MLTIQVKLPFTFMWMEVIFTLLATVFYIVGWIVILSGFGWCTTSHRISSTICDARVAAGVRVFSFILQSFREGIAKILILQYDPWGLNFLGERKEIDH